MSESRVKKLETARKIDISLALGGIGPRLVDKLGNGIFDSTLNCSNKKTYSLDLFDKSDAARALDAYGELTDLARSTGTPAFSETLESPLVALCVRAARGRGHRP